MGRALVISSFGDILWDGCIGYPITGNTEVGCSDVDRDPIQPSSLKAMKISMEAGGVGESPDLTHHLRNALPCVLS